jgi:aspartate--ammonia ligase
MGVRVDASTLRQQLALTGQLDRLKLPYHKGIVDGTLPLSTGGGIGQSRTQMLLLHKAHLGEVSVTVWPKVLTDMCARHNIHVIR